MENSDLYTINNTINKTIRNMDQESTNNGPSLRDTNQDPLSVNSGPIFMSSGNHGTQKKKKSTLGKPRNSKIGEGEKDKKILVKQISKKKRHTVDVSTNYGPSSRGPIPFQNDDMFSNLFQNSDMFSNDGPPSKDPFPYDDNIFSNNCPFSSSGFSSTDMQPISSNNVSSSMDMYKQNTTDQLLQRNLQRPMDQKKIKIATKKMEQQRKNIEKIKEKKEEKNIQQLTPIIKDLQENSTNNYQIKNRNKQTTIYQQVPFRRFRTIREQGHVPIDDDGIEILAKSISNTKRQITSIELPDNKITDNGVIMLVESLQEQNKQNFIRKVNLKNNFFKDKGVSVLATFLKNAHFLRKLDLTDNHIGIQGIRSLLDLAKANISLLILKFNVNIDEDKVEDEVKVKVEDEDEVKVKVEDEDEVKVKVEDEVKVKVEDEDKVEDEVKVKVEDEDEDMCPICRESKYKDPVVVSCCGKTFCKECIESCFTEEKKMCPLCRTENIYIVDRPHILRAPFFDSSNINFLQKFPKVAFSNLSEKRNYIQAYGIRDEEIQEALTELFKQIKFNRQFEQFYKRHRRNVNNTNQFAPSVDKIVSFYLEIQTKYPNLEGDLMSKLKEWIETKTQKTIDELEEEKNMKTIDKIMKQHRNLDNKDNRETILDSLKSDDELIIVMIPTSNIHVVKVQRKSYHSYNSPDVINIKGIFTDFINKNNQNINIYNVNAQDLAYEIVKDFSSGKYKVFGIDRNPYFLKKLSLIWKLKD